MDHRATFTAILIAIAWLPGSSGRSEYQSPADSNQGEDVPLSEGPQTSKSVMQPSEPSAVKTEPRNEYGFTKISTHKDEVYYEGIVAANGDAIMPISPRLLVNDIKGTLALIPFESKFLFVPLDGGTCSEDDPENINGFQYAEPHRCGSAKVCVNDSWFYINADYQQAFDADFEFAESFHQNRALVMSDGKHRIIRTDGSTVAELNYDQVSPPSEWCWQVINKVDEKYQSGFVDLDGNQITDLIFDNVGYYDLEVKSIRVDMDERFGFVDELAQIVIPLKYGYARSLD